MTLETILDNLWVQYCTDNPLVEKVHTLIETKENATIVNDHIAFRTFDHHEINLDAMAQHFINLGYEEKQEYIFTEKKLRAKHYEKEGCPKIFISELKLKMFSMRFNEIIEGILEQIPVHHMQNVQSLWSGIQWDMIDSETYEELRQESEYGAWLATFGFRANHFTVSVNDLRCFELSSLNRLLKSNEIPLNTVGGEIKGNAREDLLEQSSTLADIRMVQFSDIIVEVPCCYYEFAQRFPLEDGTLFQGFVTDNADKIFESTDKQ